MTSIDATPAWCSDAIATLLRQLDIGYVALSPGSSFRGLHESLVNLLGNRDPEMLLCLHEEHAVAIAHGWAKVTGTPMVVMVHANVGLMHATMAIYNAFCDRVPMLIIGGVAPMDAGRRISPAHWYHSVLDQGALVRDYVKWDDQPFSLHGTLEALLRANQLTRTAPMAPCYVSIDQRMQEDPLPERWVARDVARYAAPAPFRPDAAAVRRAAEWLAAAERPVILAGRVSRDEPAWAARVALAETLGADVVTDMKVAAAFPTDHPLHPGDPMLVFADERSLASIREADVILSLDWVDMVNLFGRVWPDGAVPPKVIQVSADRLVHKAWTRDHMALPAADLDILAEPCATVPLLLDEVRSAQDGERQRRARERLARRASQTRERQPKRAVHAGSEDIALWDMGICLDAARNGRPMTLIRAPLGWHSGALPFRHPLDYLGYDGSGGIGSGPGHAVGAALALRGTARLPVALVGDGDFLMGVTALWTAVHHRIPVLVIIANNSSYFVDEEHQRTVSRQRKRSLDNAWVGQRLEDPMIDLAAMAMAQGCTAERIERRSGLTAAIQRGIGAVDAGNCHVIDVRILPDYTGLLG
jgi:thiamine pyrophosphate-dependent acetolactate synthase large subunit-like protein